MKKLAELLDVAVSYFPKLSVNGHAAGEDFLLLIAQHILDRKPKSVVECGSGISSIVIGRCLQLNNDAMDLTHPHCISMEDKEIYNDRTTRWLKERNLSNYVEVKTFSTAGEPPFYQYTLELPGIDVLIIDGPSNKLHPMSRYGAKTLFEYLSPNATIFLDDVKRAGDMMVRDAWKFDYQKLGFKFTDVDTERGACIIKRTKNNTKQRVLISLPNLGWLHRGMFRPIIEMTKDIRFTVTLNMPIRKPVEVAYCEMAELVHKEKYDWWLNIDDDNPPMRNPLDLIELDKDIIGCPTPIWRPEVDDRLISWNVMGYREEDDMHYEWLNTKGLQEVAALGMGCTLIAGRVFENKEMRYQPFMREYRPNGLTLRGTDVAFCHKAKKNGFEVWAHFDYMCKHFKEVDLTDMLQQVDKLEKYKKGKEDAKAHASGKEEEQEEEGV